MSEFNLVAALAVFNFFFGWFLLDKIKRKGTAIVIHHNEIESLKKQISNLEYEISELTIKKGET
jgi:hypothetical protein